MASKVQRGNVAMHLLIAKLLEKGVTVLSPLCEDTPYDLVLHAKDRFYRIQVKRAVPYKGGPRYQIPFKKTIGYRKGWKEYKYTLEHTDFIVGVLVPTGEFYAFPMSAVEKVKAVIQIDPNKTSRNISHHRAFDPEQFRNRITLGTDTFTFGS